MKKIIFIMIFLLVGFISFTKNIAADDFDEYSYYINEDGYYQLVLVMVGTGNQYSQTQLLIDNELYDIEYLSNNVIIKYDNIIELHTFDIVDDTIVYYLLSDDFDEYSIAFNTDNNNKKMSINITHNQYSPDEYYTITIIFLDSQRPTFLGMVFDNISNIILGMIVALGALFSGVGLVFFDDGLTFIGILTLFAFGVFLARWGFKLVLRLLKLGVKK